MLIFDVARGGENLGTGQKNPSQSARGLAQSKSWRPLEPAVNARSVLDCASPLALSDDPEILVTDEAQQVPVLGGRLGFRIPCAICTTNRALS